MSMHFEFHTPQNPLLAELIAGFYFLSDTEPGELHYQTFPNNYSILSVLKNSVVSFHENRAECRPSEKPCISSNLTMGYKEPISISYYGPVNELTIYFKPLALYCFVPAAAMNDPGVFKDFSGLNNFNHTMSEILGMKGRAEQVQALEDYLLAQKRFQVDPLLHQLLAEIEGPGAIAEIAEKMGMSRQYLNRLFFRYFGQSPTLFRKISRFRNAVRTSIKAKSLSDLTYENAFYDQSHLIRDFKELTHLSPKTFLKGIDPAKEIPWLYI